MHNRCETAVKGGVRSGDIKFSALPLSVMLNNSIVESNVQEEKTSGFTI